MANRTSLIQANPAPMVGATCGVEKRTQKNVNPGTVKLALVNRRPAKWTFSSRMKNLLDSGRKQRKLDERAAAEKASKKENDLRDLRWKKTAVSLPYNVVQSTLDKRLNEIGKVSVPNISLESEGSNLSRQDELLRCANSLRNAEDFKGLFRDDSTAPNQWIVQHKLELLPLADVMKGRLMAALGDRDPSTLSAHEMHEIALKVWSVLIPGLCTSSQQDIPENTRFLVQELLNACASSPAFEHLGPSQRADAIKGMFYFAYFNRGLQPMLNRSPARRQELEAIRPRTDEQNKELDRERALDLLNLRVADFGATISGLKLEGKPTTITPKQRDIDCGKAFFQRMCAQALSDAGIARLNPSSGPAEIDNDRALPVADSISHIYKQSHTFSASTQVDNDFSFPVSSADDPSIPSVQIDNEIWLGPKHSVDRKVPTVQSTVAPTKLVTTRSGDNANSVNADPPLLSKQGDQQALAPRAEAVDANKTAGVLTSGAVTGTSTTNVNDLPAPSRTIKKNQTAQELRAKLWSAREGGRHAIKKTVVNVKEAIVPEEVLAAQRKYGKHATPEQIQGVAKDLKFQQRRLEKLAGLCIPKTLRSDMGAETVVPFLKRVANGTARITDAGRSKQLGRLTKEEPIRKDGAMIGFREYVDNVSPKAYASGLLSCLARLENDYQKNHPHNNKELWLPEQLRSAFLASKRSDPVAWILDISRLRTEYRSVLEFRAKGQLVQSHVEDYEALCATLKVPQDVVEDQEISVVEAYSYARAWQEVAKHHNFKEWTGRDGRVKRLVPKEKEPSEKKIKAQSDGD